MSFRHAAPVALFVMVFAAHGWFYNGSAGNQNSRLDPIYSFVEDGPNHRTFRIDQFIRDREFNTGDWARANGHYYSNKAPGSTLLGIPVYEWLYREELRRREDPTSLEMATLNNYAINLAVSVFPVALSAAFLLFYLLGRMKAFDAVATSLIYAFGTLIFPFDTHMWGHTTAAALMLIAACLFLNPRKRTSDVAAGFFLGTAIVVEYLAGFTWIIFLAFLAWRREWRRAAAFVAGSVAPGAVLLAYQKICFGSFFTIALRKENPIFLEDDRFLGLFGAFDYGAAFDLLFSPERGLFLYSPILLFVIAGIMQMIRRRELALPIFASTNVIVMFFIIACFNAPSGGFTSGPRYLIPSLPFWILLLPRWSEMRLPSRLVAWVVALVSAANMFAIAATTAMSTALTNTLYGSIWPEFLAGKIHTTRSVVRMIGIETEGQMRISVFNLGERWLHLGGLASVVPAAALIVVGSALLLLGAMRVRGVIRLGAWADARDLGLDE